MSLVSETLTEIQVKKIQHFTFLICINLHRVLQREVHIRYIISPEEV